MVLERPACGGRVTGVSLAPHEAGVFWRM